MEKEQSTMNKIEQIKTELKRLKNDLASLDDELTDTMVAEYDYLLDFLSTLESEKSVPNDLEEAADLWYEKCPFPKSTWWDEGEELKLTDSRETFIAGAKWQKEQMMDEWLKDRGGCFWDGVEEGKKVMEDAILALIESRISEIIGDAQPKPALRAELQELIAKIRNQ
jgi:hypothetical protein